MSSPSSSRQPSPVPRPSRFRLERIDASQLDGAADFLISRRSRRSTAGNRMRALLDQEVEKDEIFLEVENDVDFETTQNDEYDVDIVDSDFDRSSSTGEQEDGDESEGEREIERQEKVERKAARARAVPAHIRRPAIRSTKRTKQDDDQGSKKRRISFAPHNSTSTSSSIPNTPTTPTAAETTSTTAASAVRTSSRRSAIQYKLEVEEKLREAEQKRAALPVRPIQKKKPQKTQDQLIAEALEVEEENRASLKKFLELEEERKAKLRITKEKIQGPFLRWISVGIKSKVLIEPVSEKQDDQETQPKETESEKGKGKELQQSEQTPKGQEEEETTKSAQQEHQSASSKPTVSSIGQQDQPIDSNQKNQEPNPVTPSVLPLPVSTSTTSIDLTQDPVIAARLESVAERKTLTENQTRTSDDTTTSSSLYTKTFLSLENLPSDWTWIEEFQALLGHHCEWDKIPIVPARNRPLRPRQSICPITGLPAIYKDPRTGIPFATKQAYRILSQLVDHQFIWTGGGGGVIDRHHRGGAVPLHMGVYMDRQDEIGANQVFQLARQVQLERQQQQQQQQQQKGKEKEKNLVKKSKYLDIVPTTTATSSSSSSLAPGDEQNLLQQANKLLAGSTRSGRRVSRK